MIDPPLHLWQDRLQAVIDAGCTLLRRACVIRETASTQDAARRLGPRPGDVVVAARQTAGRGRLGRPWVDERGESVTASIVLALPEELRVAVALAVGVARAIETWLECGAGIKWPNDVEVGGRKLAGILVERSGDVLIAGIGLNVGQASFESPLDERATSLRRLGVDVDRLSVLEVLLPALDAAVAEPAAVTADAFRRRDCLSGRGALVEHGGVTLAGVITAIEPWSRLTLRDGSGAEHRIPAASATIKPAAGSSDHAKDEG